jgi:hypothetical protein
MIGILVQLAFSWLIIWLLEKKRIGFLGFYPTKRRLADFALFLLITATCNASQYNTTDVEDKICFV